MGVIVALTIPVSVEKLLKQMAGTTFGHDASDDLFDKLAKLLKVKTPRIRAGCFSRVFVHKGFVVKVEKEYPSHPRSCSMRRDFKFIRTMRATPANRKHFPVSRMFGDTIMVQERCDINYDRFDTYERKVQALANKFGIEDVHEENIGWKKVGKEWVPVFIDVGFRTRPVKARKQRKRRIPKWAKGLTDFEYSYTRW